MAEEQEDTKAVSVPLVLGDCERKPDLDGVWHEVEDTVLVLEGKTLPVTEPHLVPPALIEAKERVGVGVESEKREKLGEEVEDLLPEGEPEAVAEGRTVTLGRGVGLVHAVATLLSVELDDLLLLCEDVWLAVGVVQGRALGETAPLTVALPLAFPEILTRALFVEDALGSRVRMADTVRVGGAEALEEALRRALGDSAAVGALDCDTESVEALIMEGVGREVTVAEPMRDAVVQWVGGRDTEGEREEE